MPKKEMEYFDAMIHVPWTPVEGLAEGVYEKILSIDEEGNKTRLLKWPVCLEPADTTPLVHTFWEETYIIEGCLYDHMNDAYYTAGYYGCRPPGMLHGPFTTPTGCLIFESHYYK